MTSVTTAKGTPTGLPRAEGKLGIAVFGGIGITFGRHELRLTNRKARALIAYLALAEAGREQRERLAGLLWTDTSEQNARASLRQVLLDLREALGACGCPALIAGRQDVELITDLVEVDLSRVLNDISAGKAPEILLKQNRSGDTLLSGYDDISPMFQEWVVATRAQVQEKLVRELEQAYGNDALPRRNRRLLADAALMTDPLHEAACRMVMRLAAEDGEIGSALRAYDNLYKALGEELDMEPSAPTRELVAEIKLGHFDGSPDQAKTPDASPRRVEPRVADQSGAPVVAVLPFRSIGSSLEQNYFAEGVVEDTVRILATLREPIVISSNSTRTFRNQELDLRQVGERLGAQYALSGAVRAVAAKLRLSVELAEVTGGTVLWASVYDVLDPQTFETQDDIAASIARTLVPRLRDAELRRSRTQRPEDLNAYHLMLQARELIFTLDRGNFERAGELLREALRLDPGYAPTHTATANWYSLWIGQGWSSDPEADGKALENAARSAIALDSASGRALAMVAHNRTILRRDYGGAVNLLHRALEASPNDAEALMWSSPTYAYIGETAEALRRAERAITLSPEDPFMFRYEHFMCIAHYAAGNYDEAAGWGMRSLNRNARYTSNIRMTAAALVGAGRTAEARPLARSVLEVQPEFRVSPLIAHQAFRSEERRKLYGHHLVEAGLPR
jgi:DNA-binding SARP family transcriptional activator/Tfp pilus assembly protein PilF